MLQLLSVMSALLSMSGSALDKNPTTSMRPSPKAITVYVNGRPVSFPDQKPLMVGGRVMMPLRAVLKSLPGMALVWDPRELTVSGAYLDRSVWLRIGNKTARVNGRLVDLETPAETMRGRTMVPIRFVSEALGAVVGWDDSDRRVTVMVPVLRVPGSVAVAMPAVERRYYRAGQTRPIVSARSTRTTVPVVTVGQGLSATSANLRRLERQLEVDYNAWASNRNAWMQDQANFALWSTLQTRFNSITFINGAPGYLPGPTAGIVNLDPWGWARWDAVLSAYAARDAVLQQRLAATYAAYLQVFQRVNPGGTPLVLP